MRTVLLAAVAFGISINAAAAAEPTCDRACLEGFVNQYLAALVAQD